MTSTDILSYQSGFANEYATEAVAGALPQHRNSPQRAPFDLYPELISGTAFTAPRGPKSVFRPNGKWVRRSRTRISGSCGASAIACPTSGRILSVNIVVTRHHMPILQAA